MRTSHRHRRRRQCAAAAALLVIGLTAVPASARQDQGARAPSGTTTGEGRCGLARVGQQYVRCDNLTGNGVATPAWVSER